MRLAAIGNFHYCVRLAFLSLTLIGSPTIALADGDPWLDSVAKGDSAVAQPSLHQAEDHYRRALKQVAKKGHATADVVLVQNKLANSLTLQGKIEEAQTIYRRSLRMLQRQYGMSSHELAPTLFALGSTYESEGDVSSAMALYQRALKINEKNYGPYSPVVADSLHHLGRVTAKSGDSEKAEGHYKQALSILEKQPGLESSKQMEDLLADYSDLLRKKDNISQSLLSDFQKEVLKDKVPATAPQAQTNGSAWQQRIAMQSALAKKGQSNEDSSVLLRGTIRPANAANLSPVYSTMTNSFYGQTHYTQGETLYKRMIAIDIEALGPDHPAVGDDLSALALLYISQQRYQDAEPLLTRALAIYEATYGKDNQLVIKTRTTLASVYDKLKNPEQAAGLLQKALVDGQGTLGPNNLETAQILNELAFLYFRQGRLEDASTFYQWAIASTQAAAGADSPLLAACLNDYAHVLQGLGRSTEADQVSERAKNILANSDEQSSP